MDRGTLIAALVGALIATVPILISNLVQIYLHISEKREKRREARIQDKKKWIEKDIEILMNTINRTLTILSEYRGHLSHGSNLVVAVSKLGFMAEDDAKKSLVDATTKLESAFVEANQQKSVGSMIAESFEDIIKSKYDAFNEAVNGAVTEIYMNALAEVKDVINQDLEIEMDIPSWVTEPAFENYSLAHEIAGELHLLLRNKLISIRDSE